MDEVVAVSLEAAGHKGAIPDRAAAQVMRQTSFFIGLMEDRLFEAFLLMKWGGVKFTGSST